MITAVLFAAVACSHAPLFTAGEIAQDEQAVYAVSADRRRLVRFFKDGGAATVVEAPFAITAFDLDGPRLYYALDSQPLKQIRVVTTSGGAPAVLVNTSRDITQIGHDGAAMYWVEDGWLWRYDKRHAQPRFMLVTDDLTIVRADDAGVVLRAGSAGRGFILGLAGKGVLGEVAEVFADASAVYFRRGDQLWRVPRSGGDAQAVGTLPHGAALLGVGANRVVTTAGAANICTGETAVLHGAARLAVDGCAAYEVVGDQLVATALPSSPRIDVSTPTAARPGDLLRLLGAGFDRLATVTVGGAEAAVVLADEGELDILVPKVPAAGTAVLVKNRDGGCAATFLNVAGSP